MQPNTCSPKHIYTVSPFTKNEKLVNLVWQSISYNRGVFNVSKTGAFVAYESQIEPEDLYIEIEACPVDHSGIEPWMGNCNSESFCDLDVYLADGFIACEICETELHAKSLF